MQGCHSPPATGPHWANSPRMRRGRTSEQTQADVHRSPTTMQVHLRHWCGSWVIIIKDIHHLRTSWVMGYMDFEALMKNSLFGWVYCVCTNYGDTYAKNAPPSDRPAVMRCGDGKQKDTIWWRVKRWIWRGHRSRVFMQTLSAIQSDKSELLKVAAHWVYKSLCLQVGPLQWLMFPTRFPVPGWAK